MQTTMGSFKAQHVAPQSMVYLLQLQNTKVCNYFQCEDDACNKPFACWLKWIKKHILLAIYSISLTTTVCATYNW